MTNPLEKVNIPASDRPVEVTPVMIEAGFRVIQRSGIADDYLEADRLLVAEIFRAMLDAAAPHQK